MSPRRPPTPKSNIEYGRKPYLGAYSYPEWEYISWSKMTTKKYIGDETIGQDGSLDKPYLFDDYLKMGHEAWQNYYFTNKQVDWDKWLQDYLVDLERKYGELDDAFYIKFVLQKDPYIIDQTNTMLIWISPYLTGADWQWEVTASHRDIHIISVAPITGALGNHLVEVTFNITKDVQQEVVIYATASNGDITATGEIEILYEEPEEELCIWNDEFNNLDNWWTIGTVGGVSIVNGELVIDSAPGDVCYAWQSSDPPGGPLVYISGDFDVQIKVRVDDAPTSEPWQEYIGGEFAVSIVQWHGFELEHWEFDGYKIAGSAVFSNTAAWDSDTAYLRLERIGTTLSAYYGSDGSAWTLLESETVAVTRALLRLRGRGNGWEDNKNSYFDDLIFNSGCPES